MINGFDVTNYTRKFTNGEMSQMGHEGRDHIFEKRIEDRRRGNGGRGRGGYNPAAGYNHPESNDRQANQAAVENLSEERQIVPYHGDAAQQDENTSAAHRAAQGRGAQAGRSFGRGIYGRGGRG